MRSKPDPYAHLEQAPAPGRLVVTKNAETGEHVFRLPRPHRAVSARILFMEVTGSGTKTVPVPSSDDREVSYTFPDGVRVAAFLVDENARGERSSAGPVLFFWTNEEDKR